MDTPFDKVGLPCPSDKCNSSDAFGYKDDGWGHCFSCGHKTKPGEGHEPLGKDSSSTVRDRPASTGTPLVTEVEIVPLKKRSLNQSTCKKYGYGVGELFGKTCQVAPYFDKDTGAPCAQKIKFPPKENGKKDMTITGDVSNAGLFGQQLCKGSGKMIVVTEGEPDAMAVCQSMGLSWPAVSVINGSSGAYEDIKANLEFLEGYDKVVLMFDADEPGQKAVAKCRELFTPGKVALASLDGFKDANDAVMAGNSKLVRDSAWAAQPWRPDGIIDLADIKDRIKAKPVMGHTFPWDELNSMTYGWRPGELVTWCAGTGVGKTALVSEVLYHQVIQGRKTGIVYLEEGPDRAGKRIVGLHMNKPLHLPEQEYTDAEFDAAWDDTVGKRLIKAYDHFGSLDEELLINRMKYMIKGLDVDTVILDHISMVVSGQDLSSDERRVLDFIVTKLRQLTQETSASIHIVSHLRRPAGKESHETGRQVQLSDLRGTQAIAQLSDLVIAAERDQQAEDLDERNTTQLRVLKNRYSGQTGPAGKLFFNQQTGRLTTTRTGGDQHDCPF